MRRGRARRLLLAVVVLSLVAVLAGTPAGASRYGPSNWTPYPSFPFNERLGSGGPPPFIQDANNSRKWVWTLDPTVYGASGTITFFDYANAITRSGVMQGPGGVGTNDFEIPNDRTAAQKQSKGFYFDFERPSFTQDVDVVPPDFLSPDDTVLDSDLNPISTTGYDIATDWDPTLYHPDQVEPPNIFGNFPDASVDGSANLFKLAFTVATGTQFMNMQVDKHGNYYVARRNMQWSYIDSFVSKPVGSSGPPQVNDTQFNIKPYPISDAYGWCGAIPPRDPNSLRPMAGQLIKDIAFDVFAADTGPGDAVPPFTTEVVPSFVMRSFGLYVVDVTMHSFGGVRQRFSSMSKGVHIRPVQTVDPNTNQVFPAGSAVKPGDFDFQRWFNRVSPFAAGVVPLGAWVINEGNPEYMQVVPAGTPGAVWHQNKFAGAAFIVRGDMERRVNYINASSSWAGDQQTVAGYEERYHNLIQSGAVNPRTGQPWKRADWTDWAEGGIELLPDRY
ncbi:MAG: hypothetical protein ACRDJM_11420 [Actinomycetota bacterium]